MCRTIPLVKQDVGSLLPKAGSGCVRKAIKICASPHTSRRTPRVLLVESAKQEYSVT